MTRDLNVLALFKGSERFIFVYDDESREVLIDEIRHQAADPTVPLNWFDAAVLTERVRNHQAAGDCVCGVPPRVCGSVVQLRRRQTRPAPSSWRA